MSRSSRADELVRELGAAHAELVVTWLDTEAQSFATHALDQSGPIRRRAIATLATHVREAIVDQHGSASDDEE